MHVLSLPDFSLALLAKLSAKLTSPAANTLEVIPSGFMPSASLQAHLKSSTYLYNLKADALIVCSEQMVPCPVPGAE